MNEGSKESSMIKAEMNHLSEDDKMTADVCIITKLRMWLRM